MPLSIADIAWLLQQTTIGLFSALVAVNPQYRREQIVLNIT